MDYTAPDIKYTFHDDQALKASYCPVVGVLELYDSGTTFPGKFIICDEDIDELIGILENVKANMIKEKEL